MLSQNKKNYFNQVNMVESQYDSKRSNNSSLIQNKSPLRQRENMNINTPLRSTNVKKSLSPLRSRKNQSYNTSGRSTFTKKKSSEYECQNHSSKIAKFYVQSETELLYYCENCAVRLASQGFSTMKICESAREPNPRIKEINQFLESLEKAISNLKQKKTQIDGEISKTQNSLDEEIEKVQQYYSQFYQLIDEHKNRVVEELKSQFENSCEDIRVFREKVDDGIKNSENMKKDISQSLNQVILDASQYEFRPVMDLYKSNLTKFKGICQQKYESEIKLKSLRFRGDEEAVCQKLLEELIVEWDEPEQEGKYESELSSQRNPVESLQSEEKGKSNLKQLGQLFSSFDE